MPHEVLEQRELARGQGHRHARPGQGARGRVEHEVAHLEHGRVDAGGPAQQRTQPRDEDDERERLGEVVVGAHVEAVGHVVLAVLGAEHQHRRRDRARPQRGDHVVAVEPRAASRRARSRRTRGRSPCSRPRRAVVRDVDREALRGQPAVQGAREAALVVDHQDPHHGQHVTARSDPGGARSLSGSPQRPRRRGVVMSTMSPRARWAVPAVVGAVVAAAFVAPPLVASASSDDLPTHHAAGARRPPSPRRRTSRCPAPSSTPPASACRRCRSATMAGASPVNLLDGSSTMRVWTDGDDRSRASLLGATSEYSVVHDGPRGVDVLEHRRRGRALHGRREGPGPRYETLQRGPDRRRRPAHPGGRSASTLLGLVEQFSTREPRRPVARSPAVTRTTSSSRPKSTTTLVGHVVISVDAKTEHARCACRSGTAARRLPRSRSASPTSASRRRRTRCSRSAPPRAPRSKDVTVPLPTHRPTGPTAHGPRRHAPSRAPAGTPSCRRPASTSPACSPADTDALTSVPGSQPAIGSKSGQKLLDEFGADGSDKVRDLDLGTLFDQLTTKVPEGRLDRRPSWPACW